MPYVGHNSRLRDANNAGSARRNPRSVSIGGPAAWKPGSAGANGTPRSPSPAPPSGSPDGKPDPYMEARRAANILDFIDKYMKSGLTYDQAAERVARNLMRSGTVTTRDVNSTMAKYVHAAYGKIPGHTGVQESFQKRHGDKFAAKPSKDIQPKSGVPAYGAGIPNPTPQHPPYPLGGGGSMSFGPPPAQGQMGSPEPMPDMGPPRPQTIESLATLQPLTQPQPAGGGYSQYASHLPVGSSFRNDVARLTAPTMDSIEGALGDAGRFINRQDPGDLASRGLSAAKDVLVSPLDSIKDLLDWGNANIGQPTTRALQHGLDYLIR